MSVHEEVAKIIHRARQTLEMFPEERTAWEDLNETAKQRYLATSSALEQEDLLREDSRTEEWLAQVGWRNDAGQVEITEGFGETEQDALDAARNADRMFHTTQEVQSATARCYTTEWKPHTTTEVKK